MEEINIDIVKRKENYPPKFYQVLDKLDLVMRNWVGDKMGTNGMRELCVLCGIFAIDWWLEYNMPLSARAWFIELINPKNAWEYHDKSGNAFGGQLKAYADTKTIKTDKFIRNVQIKNKTIDYSVLKQIKKDYKNGR